MSEILQNQVNQKFTFKTTVHFQNGSKETIFSILPPNLQSQCRVMQFVLSDDAGVIIPFEVVRKFETLREVSNSINLGI